MNATIEEVCNSTLINDHRPYSTAETILIAIITALLSLVTIVGNVLVMVSFKMDRRLQTENNYFLLSLAAADFTIGLVSMPLFTTYTILQEWPFGPTICDCWLALDYLCSNASVLNLLMISWDRYCSVTNPLEYRAKRGKRRVRYMIIFAWIFSFILWCPWIVSWQFIEGHRSVPEKECYIQFLETNTYVTVGTALGAFYLPVTIMSVLYWRIWRETENRKNYLSELLADNDQAGECANVPLSENPVPGEKACSRRFKNFLITLCNVDTDPDGPEDESTSPGATTPSSAETPLQSSRTTSVTIRPEQLAQLQALLGKQEEAQTPNGQAPPTGQSPPTGGDSIYTIMIRLPEPNALEDAEPSVTMITEDNSPPAPSIRSSLSTGALVSNSVTDHNLTRYSSTDLLGVSRLVSNGKFFKPRPAIRPRVLNKKKQKLQEKKHDKKAARTLSAILMAFICTWTPYNVFVVVKSMATCDDIIPEIWWNFAYYLCYMNSLINPVCYALANANFRKTYKRILTCTWGKKSKLSIIRGLHYRTS